ncbi:MerR family transcriptional regulator [Gulosibacter molinativorax]|uniref:MerR family DNA-binding transcriptional regulator n=1 Tax=Gulosibacter molinativorax TaxID=256821 RepID=A0ABT7CC03_9MICO|nr:TipAS antibiotic-recognition domain-containing protein [Gulosibacter molinativorax]MDJ1372679.1 MerR family DNA-binding transcriptional regulator [Gulosibacter molinativorax]QUY60992.1 HTH-type transcriptional activator TipA [Gulosibacter molinativorax]
MEWSIQELARLAATTSRTLRHYDSIGLLPPKRIGGNGYGYYGEAELVRLQRILLLRELGLGLAQIGEVLERETNEAEVLTTHLELLRQEQRRLDRQIAAVEHTIHALEGKEALMAEQMFDGFDHTQYQEEVEQRWGKDAYARGDSWWRKLSQAEQDEFKASTASLMAEWKAAAEDPSTDPESEAAQDLARRHVAWLAGVPGAKSGTSEADFEAYVLALADMYVADERFAANFGGAEGATFVREALRKRVQV